MSYVGDHIGEYFRAIKGDLKSLDYGSCELRPKLLELTFSVGVHGQQQGLGFN